MNKKEKSTEEFIKNQKNNDQSIVEELMSQFYPESILKTQKSKQFKQKSKSVSTLPSIMKNKLTAEGSFNKRYNNQQGKLKKELGDLERQCGKFGGCEYVYEEMGKQKITNQEQFAYYDKRIKSIDSNNSLSKILKLGLESNERSASLSKKNSQKKLNAYNKWFIPPSKRFMKVQQNGIIDMKNYVNDFISFNKKANVQIKGQYAPKIIQETSKVLGRQPLICGYAKISKY